MVLAGEHEDYLRSASLMYQEDLVVDASPKVDDVAFVDKGIAEDFLRLLACRACVLNIFRFSVP